MSTTPVADEVHGEPDDPRHKLFLLTGEGWPYLLVPLIPVAVVLEFTHAGATWVFLASALGVIPTAALMGRAAEELAARSGPGIGGVPQRHLRQRPRADHRPVRTGRGSARGGQGLDRRLDPGQHPA